MCRCNAQGLRLAGTLYVLVKRPPQRFKIQSSLILLTAACHFGAVILQSAAYGTAAQVYFQFCLWCRIAACSVSAVVEFGTKECGVLYLLSSLGLVSYLFILLPLVCACRLV